MAGAVRAGSARDAEFWNRLYAKVGNRAIATHTGHDDDAFARSGRADTTFVLTEFLDGAPRGRILEIGCGAGRMTQHLADEFAEVVALDCTAAVLTELRTRLGDRPGITAVEGSEATLRDLPDGSFDAVLSYVVFQHVSSREAVHEYVLQGARLLGSSGVAAFQFRGDDPSARAADLVGWVGRAITHRAFDRSWRGHRYGRREIAALAARTDCAATMTSHGRHLWLVLRR